MESLESKETEFVVIPGNKGGTATRARPAAGSRLSATFTQVSQTAVLWLHRQAEEVFAQADDALFSIAEAALEHTTRDALFQSIRLLRVEQRALIDGFCEAIEEGFRHPESGNLSREYSNNDSSSAKTLSLVRDDELEQQVAIRSMVVNAKRENAEPLAALCVRLDTLHPVKIYEENMPLGPALVCAAFTKGLKDLELGQQARMVVLEKLETQLVERLGDLFDVCNNLLVEKGVLPTLDDPMRRRAQKSAARPQGRAAGLGAVGLQPSGSAPPMATPALLDHLAELQAAIPLQEGPTGRLVDVQSLLQERLVLSQQSASLHSLDSEVIRLVDMLFTFMLDDRNLAEPIRDQLIRLQLPMLKLAVADKAFFSKAGHPARRLLNELADMAIGWQPGEKYQEDPLYQEVRGVVEGVLKDFATDPEVFERYIESFRGFSTRERKRAALMERRTIDQAQGVARVEAAKARVTAVFEALTAERKLPKVAHEWLNRVWSGVLFRTCLKEGSNADAWRQQVLTARDLVWSVVAPMPESSVRMKRLLPDLRKRLDAGAQSLSLSLNERRRLMGALDTLYRERQSLAERVECERERRTRERLASELRFEAGSRAANEEAQVSAAKSDDVLQDMHTKEPALPDVESLRQVAEAAPVAMTKTAHAPLPDNDEYWRQTYTLKDSWFLQREEDKMPVRCRLAAIIRDLDQFIFVNRSGAKVSMLSRLELAHALRGETLLPLEQGPLFDRALKYVVGHREEGGEIQIAV